MSDDFVAPTAPATPWSAAAFQVKRYGTRYYTDVLPTCPIAEATSSTWPGFSSIKGHKPFKKAVDIDGVRTVVPLDLHTAHQFITANPAFSAAEFYRCVDVAKVRSFARGHAIHAVAEATLLGLPTPQWALDNRDAAPYFRQVRRWIETNVDAVLAVEAVVINRTLGYGGQGDAWLKLRNGIDFYVDWKSRNEDGSHGVYDEEIAQGGAYTSAEYMIGPNAGRTAAIRMSLPKVTHGVVVSIKPDSTETFFYDLDIAAETFCHMLNAYRSHSDVGKTATRAKKVTVPELPAMPSRLPEEWRDHLRQRCRVIGELDASVAAVMGSTWPTDVPSLSSDDFMLEHFDIVDRHLTKFETTVSAPFFKPLDRTLVADPAA